MSAAPASLEDAVREVGQALGLDAVGFAPATPDVRTRRLRTWIERGFSGEMHYLERTLDKREDPRRVLASARSVIVGALACDGRRGGRAASTDAQETEPPRGIVARYAGGDDYHDVLLDRLRALEAALPALAGQPVESRSYVDTGPVVERAAAERAGLGWVGKNSCLIHSELGSHLMLGVILCDLELEGVAPGTDRCGACRACLDACPTDAFAEPYVLDATRCLSYTTIESRGAIPVPLRPAHGAHVFGCDVCQDVCPWNRSRPRRPLDDPLGLRTRLVPRPDWRVPTLEWLLSLDEEAFRRSARGTALRRAGYRGLLRNALVAAGNSGDPDLREAVARHVGSPDALLAEHARWALSRLDAVARGGGRAQADAAQQTFDAGANAPHAE